MRIVLFCYFLFATSDVDSELVNPLPQNKAVLIGTTNVAFYCASNNGWGFISWSVLPVGPVGGSKKSISTGSNVAPAYTDTYSVSNAGDITSILIIKTVNESLAGTYFCNEAAPTASAQLIVYNSDPVCTSNVSSGQNLTPGQSVQMSCSFSYTATSYSVSVNMAWSKSSSSSPVESPSPVITTTGTLTTAVSTITQTVGYSSPFPVYRCQTSFNVTGDTAFRAATNDPGYNNTAQPSSSPINVTTNTASSTKSTTTTISLRSTLLPPVASSSGVRQFSANAASPTKSTAATISLRSTLLPPVTSSSGVRQFSVIIISNSTISSTDASSGSNTKIAVGVALGIGLPILLIVLILVICYCIRKKGAGGGQMPESLPESELGQINATTYQELADRSAQQAHFDTQLPSSEAENPALNDGNYETFANGTSRTYDYEHEYDQIRFPLEKRNPCYYRPSTSASEYCNLDQ